MIVVTGHDEARKAVRDLQARGQTVGLVPTMGALHEGHLSLVRAARDRCDAVVVSIFVNPAQFGPAEDLDRYPRRFEEDLDICRREGVGIVFAPDVAAMYPDGFATSVRIERLTAGLCGPHRPGHFEGVTTVVTKLFNILPADEAFFGEKDYQQLVVIKRLVRDLDLPIEIVACPTVREADGLAMSSRNAQLTPDQRRQAVCLNRALIGAAEGVGRGERHSGRLIEAMRREILGAGPAEIDYVEIVDPLTLEPVAAVERGVRICLAVRIGECRLIDNMGVDMSGEIQ